MTFVSISVRPSPLAFVFLTALSEAGVGAVARLPPWNTQYLIGGCECRWLLKVILNAFCVGC